MRFFERTGDNTLLPSLLRIVIVIATSIVRESKSDIFFLGIKRLLVLSILSALILLVLVWNHLGFLLDDIFFPDWSQTQIHQPVFIIGNARSGTTYMHKLMCMNPKFESFRTWEILFGQSITFRKLILILYKLDLWFGSPFSQCISSIECLLWGKVHVHAIGLSEFEEDEWLMISIGMCQLLLMMFPLAFDDCLGLLVYFDELPQQTRAQVYSFYLNCVKKRMYNKSEKIFISKNPTFTLRILSILEKFKGAKFICMVRDPSGEIESPKENSMLIMLQILCLLWCRT